MLAHNDVRRFELNRSFCGPSVLSSLLVAVSVVARPPPRNARFVPRKLSCSVLRVGCSISALQLFAGPALTPQPLRSGSSFAPRRRRPHAGSVESEDTGKKIGQRKAAAAIVSQRIVLDIGWEPREASPATAA
jgi:hypothetical protein